MERKVEFRDTDHISLASVACASIGIDGRRRSTSQQIVEAFAERDVPRYIIGDRDDVYGNEVRLRIASLHMRKYSQRLRVPGGMHTPNA